VGTAVPAVARGAMRTPRRPEERGLAGDRPALPTGVAGGLPDKHPRPVFRALAQPCAHRKFSRGCSSALRRLVMIAQAMIEEVPCQQLPLRRAQDFFQLVIVVLSQARAERREWRAGDQA